MIDPTAETTELPHVPERPEPVACPWCGTSTQVGDKYIGSGTRQAFFVFCDESRCSAIGPARSTPDQAVTAWDLIALAVADVARAEHAFRHHYRVGQMDDGRGWYVSLRGAATAVGEWDGKHLHPTWQAAIDAAIASEAKGKPKEKNGG